MRSAVLLLLAACATASHGCAQGPPYEDWYAVYPATDMPVGPVSLDPTNDRVNLYFTSELTLTTSSVDRSTEPIGMHVRARWAGAKVRLIIWPALDGGDPISNPNPNGTADLGDAAGPETTIFEGDVFTESFRNCSGPCVRSESYRFTAILLEGDSTELTWTAENGVRLHGESGVFPDAVPADDETFTLVLGNP